MIAEHIEIIPLNKEITTNGHSALEVRLSGKLTRNDYEFFVPEMERFVRELGKLRLLLILEDFDGWTAGALWEDFKFDLKHFNDIERLAIVGDEKWEKGMAFFCKPFTTAEVKFFPPNEIDSARSWVAGQS